MTSTQFQKRVLSFQTIIREMYQFSVEHNLKMDAGCHHRIEQYRLSLFRMLRGDWQVFKQTYRSLREMMSKTWLECFQLDGWRINKQIRDFHLALTAQAGALYLYAWIQVESIVKRR